MNKKGIALISVFLVITVMFIYSSAFISITLNQNTTSDLFTRRAKALNLAEAGLDQAVTWMRAQPSPPTGNYANPWGGVQTLNDGTYSVAITDLGIVGGTGSVRRYKTTSTGTFGNMNRVLSNYVQVDNYARYIWFTNSETYGGATVWFWSLDHLNGPTHTNAHYNIYGSPQFDGEVGSVDDYIRFYNNGSNINLNQTTNPPNDIPIFAMGVDFGEEPTTMPTQALNLRSAASSGGLWLTGDSTVVFQSDGTMNVTNSNKGWTGHNMPLPANGAMFVKSGSLTASGTVNGRVTVGASSNINIPSNIVYASDPRTNPSSDDTLGIIAERNVVISSSAPQDLEIDGCVMALNNSFYLNNWSSGSPKGTLTVYGGIIQKERGPVGTFNGSTGQKISGYSKDYSYDSRLVGTPPPFMPSTGDYITLSWEED